MHPRKRKANILKIAFMRSCKQLSLGAQRIIIKIILGDCSAKVGSEDQDRSGFGNCGLQEESNDTELRLPGLAGALNMVMKSTTFPTRWRSDCRV
jgi:hypothetical protein